MSHSPKERIKNQESEAVPQHAAQTHTVQGDGITAEGTTKPRKEPSAKTKDSVDVSMQHVGSKSSDVPKKEADNSSVLLCRLCAVPCQGAAPVFLFRHPPHHPGVLPKDLPDDSDDEVLGDILSMIRATLPINVCQILLTYLLVCYFLT